MISGVGHPSTRRQEVGARRALRLGAVCLLGLALTGCSQPPSITPLRDPGAPIGATTRFDAGEFSGSWFIVARFDDGPQEQRQYSFNPDEGMIEEWTVGRPDQITIYSQPATGVLQPANPAGAEPLVVLWVDEGFRTAALGARSGKGAVVLDRKPVPGADRLAAATEVLEFYGWDTSRLRRVGP